MKRKPPTKKFQEGGSVSGIDPIDVEERRLNRQIENARRSGIANRARERALEDLAQSRRQPGLLDRARERVLRDQLEAARRSGIRNTTLQRQLSDLESRRLAAETPRGGGRAAAPQTAAGGGGAGGGGGGRAMVAAPGSSPVPRGGDVITGGRSLVPQRGIPIETPRFPASAPGLAARMLGPAGAALSALQSTPANVGEREELARVTAAMQAEQDRRMNEADADSARTAPARVAPTRSPRPRPRRPAAPRESEADRLNEISLAFARGERPRGGAADNIGRAMGIEGYKKGGMIGKKPAAKPLKKAAGGTVPKPKVPGRSAGRPATAVKPMGTRSMAKAAAPKKPVAMPAFKKGGKVTAKGKRK